jgi:GntR family transcriptional regulator
MSASLDLTAAQGGPLYLRIAERLAQEIARAELGARAALPPERRLVEQLGVSRVTVRRALEELERRGVVLAAGRRGWFVAAEPVGEPPNVLQSFTQLAAERGLVASADVLSTVVRAASLEESDALRVAPGAPVFELARTRLLNGVPVALDHSRVPLELAPSLPRRDFAHSSLYALLEEHGAAPTRSEYSVHALAADPREAALLGVPPGEPLLVTTAVTFDRRARPVELSRVSWIGERYRFRATLFSAPLPGAQGAA